MRKLNKFVCAFLMSSIFPSILSADTLEDEKQVTIMSALATTSLQGSAMKTTLQAAIDIKKTDVFTHAKAMEAMEVFRRSNKAVDVSKFGGYLTFKNLTDSEEALRGIKLEKISAVKKLHKLKGSIDALVLPFDMLDLGTNTYQFIQNAGKAIDSSGNVWSRSEAGAKATKNVMDAYQASVSVATTVVKFLPKSSAANYWANNAFAKGVSSGGKYAKGAGVLGAITIGAQIESIIYQHFRDGSVNEIRDNIFSDFKISIDNRKRMASQLTDLYITSMESGSVIGAGEIADILASYPIHRPRYSGYTEDSYQLSQLFINRTNNIDYLTQNYTQSSFTDLSNPNRILVALDALVDISTKEDAEISAYLQETVTNGGSVADLIFSGLEGSSIYDIYDTTSLKQKMFPYYATTTSGFDHYNGLYKIAFKSEVATYMQQRLAVFGREIRRLQDAADLKEARDDAFSSLLEIPATQAGDKIAVTFGLEVDYRDELLEAAALNLPFRLRYQDSTGTKVVDATYDQATGRLIFDAPTIESIKLLEVLMPRAPRWDGDTDAGYSSYSMPIATSINIEVYQDVAPFDSTEECTKSMPDVKCDFGIFKIGSIGINGKKITVHENTLIVRSEDDLKLFDISQESLPKYISSVEVSNDTNMRDLLIYEEFALVVSQNKVVFVDIKDRLNPKIISNFNNEVEIRSISLLNHILYIASSEGLKVVDISNPEIPSLVDKIDSGGLIFVQNSGKYLITRNEDPYTTNKLYDVTNPSAPQFISLFGYTKVHNTTPILINDSIYNPKLGVLCDIELAIGSGENVLCKLSYKDSSTVGFSVGETPRDLILEKDGKYVFIGSALLDISTSGRLEKVDSFDDDCLSVSAYKSTLYCLSVSGVEIYNATKILPSILEGTIFENGSDNYNGTNIEIGGGLLYSTEYIYDLADPTNPVLKGEHNLGRYSMSSEGVIIGDNAYYINGDLTDPNEFKGKYYYNNGQDQFSRLGVVENEFIYYMSYDCNIYITNLSDGFYQGKIRTNFWCGDEGNPVLQVKNKYVYTRDIHRKLVVVDFTTSTEPKAITNSLDLPEYDASFIYDKYLYISHSEDSEYGSSILDISNPSNPELVGSFPHRFSESSVTSHYVLIVSDGVLKIVNLVDPIYPEVMNDVVGVLEAEDVSIFEDYAYITSRSNFISIIDWKKVVGYNLLLSKSIQYGRSDFVPHKKNINLITMSSYDDWQDDVFKPYTGTYSIFTELQFDNEINKMDLVVNLLESTYKEITVYSIGTNTITLRLVLDKGLDKNGLKLSLRDGRNNNSIKINGQDTLIIEHDLIVNNLPRLADNQGAQMIGEKGEPASMLINTYDPDGDIVLLSVIDDDGGNVFFDPNEPNRLSASFSSDDKAVHTVKIALNDGKETVEKSITVLHLDDTDIQALYSDVDENSSDYSFSDIAFVTKQGVFSGQYDPSDPQLRIFRPSDNASMAEVLKVIINAGVKTDKFELESSVSYLKTFPNWVSPYYTYARESGAIDDIGGDLSILYPTREQLAQLLSKLLKLDEKLAVFDSIAIDFVDKDTFTNDAMHRYGQIVKVFGLFMTDDNAFPQQKISRAELASVIKKIFMMPSAELVMPTEPVELGGYFDVSVSNIKALIVSSDFSLVDSSADIGKDFAINQRRISPNGIDTYNLNVGENQAVVMIDNNGVRDIIVKDIIMLNSKKLFTLNIDGSAGEQLVKPLTDGLLVLRYMFGFRDDALVSGAIEDGAVRSNATEIQEYLQAGMDDTSLDIDNDGEIKPLTDGLLVLRYLFGFRGDSLVEQAVGDGASRSTATEIEAYLGGF